MNIKVKILGFKDKNTYICGYVPRRGNMKFEISIEEFKKTFDKLEDGLFEMKKEQQEEVNELRKDIDNLTVYIMMGRASSGDAMKSLTNFATIGSIMQKIQEKYKLSPMQIINLVHGVEKNLIDFNIKNGGSCDPDIYENVIDDKHRELNKKRWEETKEKNNIKSCGGGTIGDLLKAKGQIK